MGANGRVVPEFCPPLFLDPGTAQGLCLWGGMDIVSHLSPRVPGPFAQPQSGSAKPEPQLHQPLTSACVRVKSSVKS